MTRMLASCCPRALRRAGFVLGLTGCSGGVSTGQIAVSPSDGSTAPWVSIGAPATHAVSNEGVPVLFRAEVGDAEDDETDLTVSWASDIDGELSSDGAASDGVAQFYEATLTPGQHIVTVTVTDSSGEYAQDMVAFRVNGLPSAPGVLLSPDPATAGDQLVAAIGTESTDAEGDAIAYDYAWTVDGSASDASTSATLPASATVRGETWAVLVTPRDAYGAGDPGVASITIDNVAPELDEVTLSPDPVSSQGVLTELCVQRQQRCGWGPGGAVVRMDRGRSGRARHARHTHE